MYIIIIRWLLDASQAFDLSHYGNMFSNRISKDHRRKCESQENYSRRDNLIITGVTEENNEDMSTCKRLVRNIFIQKLNISEIEVNSMNSVRCHSIGKTALPNGTVNRKRPIIVRSTHIMIGHELH